MVVDDLEKAPLLSDGAEGPGVGNGKGKAVFIRAAKGPESQAAKLESDSAAVPVIARLHDGVLQEVPLDIPAQG